MISVLLKLHIHTSLSSVVYPTIGSDRRQRTTRVDHCPADCCAKTSSSGKIIRATLCKLTLCTRAQNLKFDLKNREKKKTVQRPGF